MNSNDVIALSDLETGGRGTVVGLEGEGRFLGHMLHQRRPAQRHLLRQRLFGEGSGFLGRMAALGFNPGAAIDVVRNDGFGPLIVSILDTQIALGRGQASRIYVRREGR